MADGRVARQRLLGDICPFGDSEKHPLMPRTAYTLFWFQNSQTGMAGFGSQSERTASMPRHVPCFVAAVAGFGLLIGPPLRLGPAKPSTRRPVSQAIDDFRSFLASSG